LVYTALSYRYSIPLLLWTNCQLLEQSITERHWCYDVEQLQKSAWEKKKSEMDFFKN